MNLDALQWVDILPAVIGEVSTFNERHGLRAADAGHLFCATRANQAVADLRLICFDEETCKAARTEKIALFSP